ncbi:MAG: PD-(D/E)XK nuclease family protein, partial [Bacteroidaceae bacterium]|nr:PD-(D/E)XK nuclease family protein [Bacteroidaceae bacterium]
MGLLETRNLDFKNVIMLSVNEGQLPKSDKRASLIPYTLRAAFGMTTIEKEVSLYAYYYYRLLQRAESITLLYNSSSEGRKKGEMSRFMLQTLAEKDELFGPSQEIVLQVFTAASETIPNASISVKKDEEVIAALRNRFDGEHILSPSAINTYMKCPLKFYLQYVAGLQPEDEVSDDIDTPLFGTIFHDTMHHLYLPWEGKPFPSQEVRLLAENEAHILQALNNAFAINLFHCPPTDKEGNLINYGTAGGQKLVLNGTQLINRHVIKEFVLNQLNADAQMAEELESEGGHWQIISQEQKYTTTQDGHLLGGYIDRLDLLASPLGNRIRIVDYKTSSKAHAAKTIEDLFDPQKCTNNYHLMQALYYCQVLTAEGAPYEHDAVVPALMYCAKDYGNNYSGILKLTPPDKTKKENITDFKQQYGAAYQALLSQKINEIFTPYDEDSSRGTFTQCE